MDLKQMVYSLPPFFTALLLAGLAATVVIRKRRGKADTLFALLCLFGSFLYIDMLITFNAPSARVAAGVGRIGHLFHPFLLPIFVHFFHVFLGIAKRSWVVRFAYGYAVVVALCAIGGGWVIADARRFAFGYFSQGGPLFFLMAAGAAVATGYNLFILSQAIRREKRSIYRNRLWYVLMGFGVLGIMTSLNCLPFFGVPLYPPGAFGFLPLLFFAAGFFRYDLLDAGWLLRKGGILVSLTVSFTLLALLGIRFLQLHFQGGRVGPVLWAMLVVLFFAATFSFPLVSRLERLWGRGAYDLHRTLERVSQTIATVLDGKKITSLLHETIVDLMQVKQCTLFLADPSGGLFHAIASAGEADGGWSHAAIAGDARLVGTLKKGRQPILKQKVLGAERRHRNTAVLDQMGWLRAEAVFPMCFKDQLKGFLVLGEKRSARIYSSRDIDLLVPLCHQSAVAIQNAQAYQSITELNATLEAKVAARTAALEAALVEKERSQEHLVRSESLAALGQLVAGVAHEMNNPLASVTSLLQSILEELSQWDAGEPLDGDLLDDLRFADKELARAKSIVVSLLGLSRQTQTYEESVDMNLVVRDALRVLYNQYKHRSLTVEEDLSEELPMLQSNFANLGQVVLNIVQNAIQAVEDDTGRVILTTTYEADSGWVTFRCCDNGEGIPGDLRQDVFKPFFTTKPVGHGTGLGLYVCHQIVQRHRGTIELADVRPRGTRVTVRLPMERM